MNLGLREKVVLVTGSSSGIGQAAAVAFAGEGARVAVTYHENQAGAEATAEQVRVSKIGSKNLGSAPLFVRSVQRWIGIG